MKYYLAYGSNLNMRQMKRRCPTAVPVGTCLLEDYELVFRNVATIEPKKGSYVPLGIWKISASDERSLDIYEGFPHLYHKETFPIHIGGEEVEAMAYIMNDGIKSKNHPATSYLMTILEGYNDFGFKDTNKLIVASVTK